MTISTAAEEYWQHMQKFNSMPRSRQHLMATGRLARLAKRTASSPVRIRLERVVATFEPQQKGAS